MVRRENLRKRGSLGESLQGICEQQDTRSNLHSPPSSFIMSFRTEGSSRARPQGEMRRMITATPARPARSAVWLLLAVLLVGLLISSHDLPARRDRAGPRILAAKLQWTTAWVSLKWLGFLPAPSAELLVRLDPELRSHRAREAAHWLAQSAPDHRQRLRWAARLARRDPNNLQLLRRAVRAAIGTHRCDLLRAATSAAQALPAKSPARRDLANEFASRHALDRWGSIAIRAGRKVAPTTRLARAAHMLQASARVGHARGSTKGRVNVCAT